MPEFVFATCRAGSEAALKREVAARHGDLLTPAFMRPQLITWKARQRLEDRFELGAVFASVSGRSLGNARTVEEVAALMPEAGELHVFPRASPEDGLDANGWKPFDALRETLAKLVVKQGDAVLDVIVGGEGEPWFVGTHRQSLWAHPDAGALTRVTLPGEAPSRAWLKMEQALAWAGVGSLAGKVVLELGCAPGGGSYSMLQCGATVIGVDTGEMDERVLA
ncbi:MAG TPA: SAM-dependent methyltransferase, partial [Prosthecobacter sp.]|nr:SAM-dependent methyltransferase [Prosthecobacter sp.]